MKHKEFFSGMLAFLKDWTLSGKKVFGENVFITPSFPIQQLSSLGSPSAFIMDMGAYPYIFPHQLIEQGFSIGFWQEILDRIGQENVLRFMEIEESLIKAIREIKSINCKKVQIIEGSKRTFVPTAGNFPALLRAWDFSVLLEI